MPKLFFPQFAKAAAGLEMHPGLTLLECARRAGVEIHAECNGNGTCGSCVVRIEHGVACLSRRTLPEEKAGLADGERLACQARIIKPAADLVVYIRDFGRYEILQYAVERDVPLCPGYAREGGAVRRDGRTVDAYRGRIFGIALDVGTTTLVFDLVDLETGDVLATAARLNPQISFGNDVISRIDHVLVHRDENRYLSEDERRDRVRGLQKVVVGAVNDELGRMAGKMGEDVGACVYDTVVVGNPTMRDLFFGIDVSSLGLKPFEPRGTAALTASPADLGLAVNPAGSVYGAALIGGHLGADALANILAAELYRAERPALLLDIGTNGEVVLGNRDRLVAASAAAGGAFEGVSVSHGIGAIEGAVKEVRISDGQVVYSTIGNKFPVGICGSGLIDVLAEMLDHGIMSKNARIEKDFYLTADIGVSQADVFQLITSKAAMRTAQEIALKYFPAPAAGLERLCLSGGFGNFINVENAIRIGLLLAPSPERVEKIGNGALEGAREMLLCLERRRLAESLARGIEHLKTNEIEPEFDFIVARNMYFE